MKYERGSQWRKWDLHVHTPASFHWSGPRFRDMQPEDEAAALEKIVAAMNASDVAVFGIMDYWTFDGYLRLRKFVKQRADIKLDKTVFPGIELRVEAPVNHRLNVHAIFSDDTTEQQLLNFRSQLRIGPNSAILSDEALVDFGKSLGPDKQKLILGRSPSTDDEYYIIGAKSAEVSRTSLVEARKALPGACFIIMPWDCSDGLEKLDWQKHPHSDMVLCQLPDIFETRDLGNRDLFLGFETDANKAFLANFQHNMGRDCKPAICGSDAHSIGDYGNYPSGKACWVKADPTFAGLRQLINEPRGRSFIGTEPPKLIRVRENPTKYIRSVNVKKSPSSTIAEKWFSSKIELSPDLVAIIGKKGSGKSALADIIGLLGDTRNEQHFSFLSRMKFRHPKKNYANEFHAQIIWESDQKATKKLSEVVNAQSIEVVKYIPQNFLETICNEIGTDDQSNFNHELRAVIFSHVQEKDRLGQDSLDDLINYRTSEIQRTIDILQTDIGNLNRRIIQLETQSSQQHQATLKNQLKLKQDELTAHAAKQPAVVTDPAKDTTQSATAAQLNNEIAQSRAKLLELTKAVTDANEKLKALQIKLSVLDRIDTQIANIRRSTESAIASLSQDTQQFELRATDLVKVEIDDARLRDIRKTIDQELASLQKLVQGNEPSSYPTQQKRVTEALAALQLKLDGPNQRFQQYLTDLAKWEELRQRIEGDENTTGSLKYYERAVADLQNVPKRLDKLKEERAAKTLEIYRELHRQLEIYTTLYSPVQQFMEHQDDILAAFNLSFDASIVDRSFEAGFFDIVGHHVSGSFCGVEEGQRVLRDLIAKHGFSNEEDLTSFIKDLFDHLARDHRYDPPTASDLGRQLKKEHTALDLYNYVYSLGYLQPQYTLKLGESSIEQLSPGERGTLLLLFYLLVDNNDIPLIIDQPEENLDNDTIFTVLVRAIKRAKERRQIIIVTHNPNLAVVCDAEQVIRARRHLSDGNRIEYLPGAIEHPEINEELVTILEGTRPAFDTRDQAYSIVPRRANVKRST